METGIKLFHLTALVLHAWNNGNNFLISIGTDRNSRSSDFLSGRQMAQWAFKHHLHGLIAPGYATVHEAWDFWFPSLRSASHSCESGLRARSNNSLRERFLRQLQRTPVWNIGHVRITLLRQRLLSAAVIAVHSSCLQRGNRPCRRRRLNCLI